MNWTKFSIEKLIEFAAIVLYFIGIFLLFPISSAVFLAYFIFPILQYFNQQLKIPFSICLITGVCTILFFAYHLILFIIQTIVALIPIFQDLILSMQHLYPFLTYFFDILLKLAQTNTAVIFSSISSSLTTFFNIILFTFTFFFSLFESKNDRYWFFSFTPKFYRKRWLNTFKEFSHLMGRFFSTEIILFSVTFICLTIIFYFFEFPHFINIAFLVSLADLLPMLGLGIFFIPACIFLLISKQIPLCIIFLCIYIILIIVRQLIESKLWASSFKIHTAQSFVIMAASVLLFNFYGLIIGPILMITLIKLRESNYF